MRTVFNDHKLEEKFQRDGYAIINFLNNDEVEGLKQQYFDLLPLSGGNITEDDAGLKKNRQITYDFTFIDKNIEFKRKVYDVITNYFAPHVDQVLNDYTPIIANYIRKKTNDGEVPLHQNWAFVDESKYTSVSIWCPLVDSNEQNGALKVVPGSHKRFGEIRGPKIPWELDDIKDDIINNHLVPCNIKAGQAVVLDDSIVHYSAINKTDELRLAIQLILTPSEVPSIHYDMNPKDNPNEVEMLEVDREFYMQFNPWKKPENVKKIKSIPFTPHKISLRSFEERLSAPRFDHKPQKGLFEKLKAVFS